jgi:methyl-accepting chemotaxis protein
MAAMGVITFINLSHVQESMKTVVEEKLKKTVWANTIINHLNESAIAMRDIILTDDASLKKQLTDRQNELSGLVGQMVDSLKSNLSSDKEKQLFDSYVSARAPYTKARTVVVDNMNAGNNAGAIKVLTTEFKAAQSEYVKTISNLIDYENDEAHDLGAKAASSAETTTWITIIINIFAIALGFVISYVVAKSIVNPIGNSIDAADNIAAGNMNVKLDVDKSDETGMLMKAMKQMSESVEAMVADANHLAEAAINGKLDVRADASKYQGEFKNLIIGLNNTLDAVINPLNVTAEYVDRISKGDIPPKITDDYKGDFNEIKNNLNQCIDAIESLVKDTKHLAKSATDGRVDTRAEAIKHQGDFRLIVQGINETLDAMLDPVNETVKALARMSEGDLKVRVQGNFKGDHAILKNNLNQTLDMLPLKEIQQVMQAMANGDLTIRMKGEYKGDSLTLKNSVNDTLESLNEILSQVSTTVEEVTRGALQVSDASTNLSQGATEQAASLEEITSSMSEIGSQTRLNAENANQANGLTQEARDAAERGNNEMGQLNEAMTEINESSKNISKIIKVIDEIAFQTNLLALNAAVEAARAGRHGKGFAVVAEEVRNLAARSATAAKETAELIENSMKTVERGSSLAVKTGEALEDIKNSSVKVADIVGEITTSSNEQAQGISQINEGLSQIDKVTQTNTASAEQSASAAEELSGQANQLRELIARFRLSASGSSYAMTASRSLSGGRGSYVSRALPAKSNYEDSSDMDNMLDFDEDNYKSASNPTIKSNPGLKASDIINLDEDDFGRY